MNKRSRQALNELLDINKQLGYINSINKNLLYWDTIKNMPKKGVDYRKETIIYLSKEYLKISKDPRISELIEEIEESEISDIKISSMIRNIRKKQAIIKVIPEEEYIDYLTTLNEAETLWNESRKKEDFNILIPSLTRIINHLRNFSRYFGYRENLYDGMLSYNHINFKYAELKPIFQDIKNTSLEILESIGEKKCENKKNIFYGRYDIEKQKVMSKDILNYIGFDYDAGRIDIGNYPTVLPISNNDVRIFTKYSENDFRPGFTTAFHTGSQAVYEQGIDSDLYSYLLAEPASTTIQEAVARYYENIVGKSFEFWTYYYTRFQELFPAYKQVKLDEFYRSLNSVEPSHIRMDADELTYNLHTILRSELENDLINGNIQVKDLREVWNNKFYDYFNLKVPNDNLGILQDVHWVSGYYGYFPNYILGNIYASQIDNAINEKIADSGKLIENGRFIELNEWFYTNIYSQGAIYNTEELMLIATDEVLNAEHYRLYLQEKFTKIYGLNFNRED